jgi:hypothetical protein
MELVRSHVTELSNAILAKCDIAYNQNYKFCFPTNFGGANEIRKVLAQTNLVIAICNRKFQFCRKFGSKVLSANQHYFHVRKICSKNFSKTNYFSRKQQTNDDNGQARLKVKF